MKEYRLSYDGKTKTLWGLWLKKIVLSIITLGIYSFWGKTQLRKYVTHSFQLNGDRFEYIGTGKELFLGFLRALPFIILYFGGCFFLGMWVIHHYPHLEHIYNPVFSIITFYLLMFGYYSALRYRVSRLTWRGIRGHFEGSSSSLAFAYMRRILLNIITLGLLIPRSNLLMAQRVYDHLFFGSVRFHFTAPIRHRLMKTHIITGLLVPFTLGFSRLWYQAKLTRCICEHLSLANMTLKTTVTGKNLFKLHFLNTIIFIITLGFGIPWMNQRNFKFFADHFVFFGDLSKMKIYQSQGEFKQTGEGLETIIGDGSFLG